MSHSPQSGVIPGQNCVLLLDAALNDLSFSELYFITSSVNRGCSNQRCPFIVFFREKVPFYSCFQGESALLYLCGTVP